MGKAAEKVATRKKIGPTKLFVLDTNVLLHDPMCLFRFEEHDIYLPMIVLEELDVDISHGEYRLAPEELADRQNPAVLGDDAVAAEHQVAREVHQPRPARGRCRSDGTGGVDDVGLRGLRVRRVDHDVRLDALAQRADCLGVAQVHLVGRRAVDRR